ncbi:hypothetical protein J7T55_015184 [Diaporthe amygdali]|uniref:uncharacterized protein n=1 Tax=Phomopsis amygdali TaxID=1214568 RepID=UPI0022FEBE9B|nr:uncharacterized protein J7T55_015184 [Diaporthe amygdali]KAJ0120457.1 hypothetical protein J7T55_015184 [Diaporthe amygdali]
MPARTQFALHTIFTGLFVFGVLTFIYHNLDQVPASFKMASQDNDILSQLHISLSQASKSPPAISIKVTNNSPKPVTILTWDSPLDQLALSLGTVYITPSDASEPLEISRIMVQRKTPPSDESLVSLAPGESRENQVELRELLVPAEKLKGKKSTVQVKGRWMGVWPKSRDELNEEAIEKGAHGGGAVAGTYSSESVEIEVD